MHVDQHKDTREPENYDVDVNNLKDVFRYTNEVLNVGSFIKPALKYNIFSELIIIDSLYGFDLEVESEFVFDIDLDIFSSDMDYIPFELKFYKIKNLIKSQSNNNCDKSLFYKPRVCYKSIKRIV